MAFSSVHGGCSRRRAALGQLIYSRQLEGDLSDLGPRPSQQLVDRRSEPR